MLNKLIENIPILFKFLIKIYCINLILFFLIRLFFYFYNQTTNLNSTPLIEKLMAFKMGLEFDTAVFCWVLFLPFLLFSIATLLKNLTFLKFGNFIFIMFQLILHFICVANIPFYNQFGTHLNNTAFLWSDNLDFAFGIIFGNFSYWGFLFLYALIIIPLIYLNKKAFKTYTNEFKIKLNYKWYKQVLTFIMISALITVGARGRISDRSGIHEGVAIVSQNNYINKIAINPNFTFWKTIVYNNKSKKYIIPNNINEQIAYTRKYLTIQSPFVTNIDRTIVPTNTTTTKYNFVIIVMESMSVYKMGYYNGKNLTPHLNNLIKESVFFNNFFSSGIHTFNGLFSTTSGYPSIYDEKSMKSYVKSSFNGLGSLLYDLGYENYFYTTHDPHFDNMEGFFKLNKFNNIISQYNFDNSLAESSLGVPDHVLLDKLIEINKNRTNTKPFLSVVMTASDHGPWKIPENINFKPNGNTVQENCTLYADWSIGRFMEMAKKEKWYNNTVFIFLGDHGLSMGHTYEMPLSYNHIPCVIHQPKLFKPDTISSPCYQPDIPATVMGIINTKFTNQTFGINILKEKHPFVVFSADDKVGCVDDNGFYFYKTFSNGNTYLRKYKNLDPVNYKQQNKINADTLEKNMMKVYETANYLIRKNYFLYN